MRALHKPLHAALLAIALLAGSCSDANRTPDNTPKERGGGYAAVQEIDHPPVNVPEGSPRVAFLGDSISAGLHLSPSSAFPAALQRLLAEDGLPFFLTNAGVSGDTTKGGLERLAFLMQNTSPDIVVVELGANDGLRGQQLAATEASLRAILERVKEEGARPLLLGMNVPTNLGEYATDFAAIYPRVAADLDVPVVERFLEGVGGIPEMNLQDGIHPTPEGHDRLARNAEDALAKLVAEVSGADPTSSEPR